MRMNVAHGRISWNSVSGLPTTIQLLRVAVKFTR
jgi:hypothetical protein